MGEYTVKLTTEQEKALLTDMISIQQWIENAIYNKARQCIDKVCEEALDDASNTILTTEEKTLIASELAAQGHVIGRIKFMPESIKMQIVAAARVKSGAERNAEAETEIPG